MHYLLRHYKNKIEQKPGWNDEILKWCLHEATAKNLKPSDCMGALVLDEMKIQVFVHIVNTNTILKFVIPSVLYIRFEYCDIF